MGRLLALRGVNWAMQTDLKREQAHILGNLGWAGSQLDLTQFAKKTATGTEAAPAVPHKTRARKLRWYQFFFHSLLLLVARPACTLGLLGVFGGLKHPSQIKGLMELEIKKMP
jgi:hypothetical protein